MARLPLSELPNSKIAIDESIKNDSDLVALMVAGFCDNHSQSLKTSDDSAPRTTEDSLPNADSRNPQSTTTFAEDCGCLMAINEAEREGFEPSVPLRVHWFSRPVCEHCKLGVDRQLRCGQICGCTDGCCLCWPEDLQRLVRCWGQLPEFVRAAINQLCSTTPDRKSVV